MGVRSERTADLLKAVEDLKRRSAQIEGRRAAAQSELDRVDAEIRALGFDPGELEGELAKLDAEFDAQLDQLERMVADYRNQIKQYEGV